MTELAYDYHAQSEYGWHVTRRSESTTVTIEADLDLAHALSLLDIPEGWTHDRREAVLNVLHAIGEAIP